MKHIDEMIHLIVIVFLFCISFSVELLQQPNSYYTNHNYDYSYRNTHQPEFLSSLVRSLGVNNEDDTNELFSSSKQSFQISFQSESHITFYTLSETSDILALLSRSPPCTPDFY